MNVVLLSAIDFSLPLKNPVIIFSLVLFIILFAPIFFNKIKIPHIIGLIIAGIVIGPYGFNLLLRDSSIVLFGTVGLLYIMFTAGLEIDMEEFKRNRLSSLVFGVFTFIIPLLFGSLAAYYILDFSLFPSILLGSMLSTHTLLAYPIVSKYGIARIRSVTLTIGGTIVTDILSLLVLAAVIGMTKGDIGTAFWIRLAVGCLIFGSIVFYLFPLIAEWFFKRFDDHISQYIFVLAMVFLGSFLAEVAGLEAIIGAFLSGLALNRFIPHISPLMSRIEFVGNAFFIPFFLIGVGMLVDVSVLFKGLGAITVAIVMIVVAVSSKYIAAVFARRAFKLSRDDQSLIFGLSTARVGATLAIVLIGYNIVLSETLSGEPIRLLNEDVLNGTVLMILVTCTISSFVVEKASQVIALKEGNTDKNTENTEKILVSLAHPETVSELVDLSLMMRPHKSKTPVYSLHVTPDIRSGDIKVSGQKIMETALRQASATGNTLIPITRFDASISQGIIYTIKEHNISDILIGLHRNADQQTFFGPTAEKILRSVLKTIYIYKPFQPLNTLKNILVLVPNRAELEPGFLHWSEKLSTIAKAYGIPMTYYAAGQTLTELKKFQDKRSNGPKVQFSEFNNWDDFLIFSRELKSNDLFVVVSSRKGNPSYSQHLEKLPYYLSEYFQNNSFIILYPEQLDQNPNMEDLLKSDSSVNWQIQNENSQMGRFANKLKSLLGK
ncbi:MAG: cation:proton antiporter domain-containing protein [Daejeonella sp.]